jgi:nitroreductase
VRYFNPDRPVDRGAVQAVLEAGRLASRAMNISWGKGIVVYRDELTQAERDALKTPYASAEFDLAPVYVLWYFDMDAQRSAIAQRKHPSVPSGAIQQVGALGPTQGWSRKYVEEVVLPEVLMPASERGPRRGGNADAAVSLAQACLAAVDEGLGACLVPFDEEAAARTFGIPDTWEPVMALLLGHSLEEREAGGQRPRAPFEKVFFEGNASQPFKRDPEVVRRLEADGLIQRPAPLPWRAAEVEALSRGLGLTGEPAADGRAPEQQEVPAELAELAGAATVRTWFSSYQESWQAPIPKRDALQALQKFVQLAGLEPDAIIDDVLRTAPSGEGLVLRTRARRKYMQLIEQFEQQEGSRTQANYVRSFMIHNGVAMNPAALK